MTWQTEQAMREELLSTCLCCFSQAAFIQPWLQHAILDEDQVLEHDGAVGARICDGAVGHSQHSRISDVYRPS